VATIEDVARRAGVSVATVSRVINGSGTVSAERAALVRAAIEEMDYRPNSSGRNLRRAETKTLLVICSVALDDVLNGIHDAAGELGYRVVVNYIGRSRERMASYFDALFYGNVDGALLYSAFYNDNDLIKLSRTIPVVQCCSYLEIPNAFRVSIDEEKAAYDVTTHLIMLGCRRIGLASPDLPGAQEAFPAKRERGYRRALAEHGITYDPSIVLRCVTSYDKAYRIGQRFAALEKPVDALFCLQDILAVGVLQALKDAGISVPRDMALAGFDNFELSRLCRPRLTTISQPFYELGSVAAKMLVSRIRGEVATGQDVYLRHELIVRESSIR
jgi:LacI family repressor for deo operon, udp, cdd, tsx, nupC, and nupG